MLTRCSFRFTVSVHCFCVTLPNGVQYEKPSQPTSVITSYGFSFSLSVGSFTWKPAFQEYKTLDHCQLNVCSTSMTVGEHWAGIVPRCCVCFFDGWSSRGDVGLHFTSVWPIYLFSPLLFTLVTVCIIYPALWNNLPKLAHELTTILLWNAKM